MPRLSPAPNSIKKWEVYILRCEDGSLYTGITNHLANRLLIHNRGRGAAYTRSRLPVRLAYREQAENRGAALSREAAIKSLTRAQKVKLIKQAAACPTIDDSF